MNSPKTTKSLQLFGLLGGVLGGLVGWQLWKLFSYTNDLNWMPGLGTLILMYVFVKSPLHPEFFRAAIATAAGHVLWFVGTALFLKSAEPLLDIVFLSLGILLLWLRPNNAVVLFLGLLQFVALVHNGTRLSSVPVASSVHVALTVHCVWRSMFIIFLVSGYIRMRKSLLTGPEQDLSEVDHRIHGTVAERTEVAMARTIDEDKVPTGEGNTPEDW